MEASVPLHQLLAASRISSLPTFIAAVFPQKHPGSGVGYPMGAHRPQTHLFRACAWYVQPDIFAPV